MKKIFFTVTNDLTYDQRMIRICASLARHGYEVTLVGRSQRSSIPLIEQPFLQKRLPCRVEKGKLFYLEYNLRLLFYLLSHRMHCICAIDLDTVLPVYFASVLKNIPRVYDAHELFCEMQEIVSRPAIHRLWKTIEQFSVPRFPNGYTVNNPIAMEFEKMYGVHYDVIRSITLLQPHALPHNQEKYILYQGSVNEGRSFETLIPAMKSIPCNLVICGDGNFMEQARALVQTNNLQHKVLFTGKLTPVALKEYTVNAWIGITLFEKTGMSNYLSLANRFFDYMHAGVPQLCVDYPAYREINNMYDIAVLVSDLSPENLSAQCNSLMNNEPRYQSLRQNCLLARQVYNWQEEEKKLIHSYHTIFANHG